MKIEFLILIILSAAIFLIFLVRIIMRIIEKPRTRGIAEVFTIHEKFMDCNCGSVSKLEIDLNLPFSMDEVSKLKDGYLNLLCESQMLLGKIEKVSAEIFIDKKFTDSIQDKLNLSQIKVGRTMTVKLLGPEFEIVPKSTDTQLIFEDKKTVWNWNIRPLKRGLKRLELVVTVKLKVDGSNEMYDYPIMTKDINVKIDRAYIAKKFLSENWQWLIGTLIGSGVVVVILKAFGVLPK